MREKDNRIKHIVNDFDYLPKDYERNAPAQFYYLSFRIVRFKVKDTTEVIMTNLPKDKFPSAEIKKLYGIRWGIETSFRDLKYTIGLNYYHAIKADSIMVFVIIFFYHTLIQKSSVCMRFIYSAVFFKIFAGYFIFCMQQTMIHSYLPLKYKIIQKFLTLHRKYGKIVKINYSHK